MKFIPGNIFINTTNKFGKYFKKGQVYTLKIIIPLDEQIKYIFTVNGEDREILFSDVKEADNFLSNFQNQ